MQKINQFTHFKTGLIIASPDETIARNNKTLAPDVETIYVRAKNDAISSSLVRELLKYQISVEPYVPPEILELLKSR